MRSNEQLFLYIFSCFILISLAKDLKKKLPLPYITEPCSNYNYNSINILGIVKTYKTDMFN